MAKASTYAFDVEFFDEDFTGCMSWNVLGKRILRAAAQHAEDRGFEQVHVNGHTYLWVLSRMVVEVERMLHTSEKGFITTWLTSAYRYFTERCFSITDADGNEVGRATTIWALIDSQTRKPINLNEVFDDSALFAYIDSERTLGMAPAKRVLPTGMQPVAERQVYYSDLDKNGHLNSIRYIDYVLDTFSEKIFEKYYPSRIELAYSHESMCGDKLTVCAKHTDVQGKPAGSLQPDEGVHQFAVKNNDKVACLCGLSLKQKQNEK